MDSSAALAVAGRVGARRRAKPAVCGPSRGELRGRVGKRAHCTDTESLWPSRQAAGV
jgi:hypothetical protein